MRTILNNHKKPVMTEIKQKGCIQFMPLYNKGIRLFLFMLFFQYFSGNVLLFATTPKNDSLVVISYSGKVVDAETKKPIAYASVYLEGSNIGTVANAEGDFILKVPSNIKGRIGISHLGYKSVFVDVSNFKNGENIFALTSEVISLQEIIVRAEDPIILLKGALANISKNYSRKPAMMTGFYREVIQQNKKYVSVAEAVLEAYKASYANYFSDDRVRVVIGRKSQDVKKMDTIVVKFQGGPILPFYLDIAKNPENLIDEKFFENYTLKLTGQTSFDNIRCYIIEFIQKKDINLPLYKGKFYIDVENLAFVAAEFGISEYGLPYASNLFVKKKPLTMKVDITGADYFVKYNKSSEGWNLAYTRSELRFKCKWNKRLFSSSYVIITEMAATDFNYNDVEKIKLAETFKPSEVFIEKVDAFKNDEFWGDYNIIVPEESIINAIEKLSKKLRKQQ